jgi:hypothetical protein
MRVRKGLRREGCGGVLKGRDIRRVALGVADLWRAV